MVVVLAVLIIRLWLIVLPSSFWIDEIATVFVAWHGSNHASLLDAAPQAWQSWYYPAMKIWGTVFGFSEVAMRVPSILAMGGVLVLVARLSARLIHPESGWFAVFACLALRGINYQAANARPYALGMFLFAASLLFLVRWLDSARWLDAVGFIIGAASILYIHLLFWPSLLVFVLYAATRVGRRETHIGWGRLALVLIIWGALLLPVFFETLHLLGEARAHVIAPPPSLGQFLRSLKLLLVVLCGAGAWIIARLLKWPRPAILLTMPAMLLVLGWWFCQPVIIACFSWITHESLFVPHYLELALPGTALAATAAAAYFIPSGLWRRLSVVLGIGVLGFMGNWRELWPRHHGSDWRAAAQAVNRIETQAEIPVICPSPFIEARPPVWRPNYPLPGFLYAHLDVYPIQGRIYLFPFEDSTQAEAYADSLAGTLSGSRRFLIYGWEPQVHFWRDWFRRSPEFAGWRMRHIGPFADEDVVEFELIK